MLLGLHCFEQDIQQHIQLRDVAAHLSSLVAAVAVCVLSFLEHGRNVAPSTLLTSYLAMALFSDVIQAGLLYVAGNLCRPWSLAFAIFGVRLVLFVLELQTKEKILRSPAKNRLSPEETAGFFGVAFFWWVNRILRTGYSTILSLGDMPPLGASLDTMRAREAMQKAWDKMKQRGRFALFLALAQCLWRPNLSIVIPRLILTVLRCCQPYFISRAIAYVSKDLSPIEDRNEAFVLILLAFVIYVGMAVAQGMVERLQARLTALIHMSLVGLIHNRCLTIADGVLDESAAVTLMSNDAEAATNGGDLVHELWSQVLEFGMGMYLLAGELGWVCILPLVVVLGISRGVQYTTEHLTDRQLAFSMATQRRISSTRSMLDSMKNIKMMGLVERMDAKLQRARDCEMEHYVGFYRLLVVYFISSIALNLFSPALTLIVYAIQAQLRGAKSIDVGMAFASLAIVELVALPANTLLGILPEAASVLAASDRIREYLLGPGRQDARIFLGKQNTSVDIITMDHVTVRPTATGETVLRDICTRIERGHVVVVSGGVGAGKTTLAKAILGDLKPEPGGVIKIATQSIAYCSQTPWLVNGTAREAIRGPPMDDDEDDNESDDDWYRKVVHACDLEQDFALMLHGDRTVVGSRGTALSGGQKQRVALARAVYARRDLIILDDVLSALDATTERHIIDNLIGPRGLFKELGTTVILITHATQHLAVADHIIILGEHGTIVEQGTWKELRGDIGYIGKVVLQKTDEQDGDHVSSEEQLVDRTESHGRFSAKQPDSAAADHTRKPMTGDTGLYGYYFNAIGPHRLLFVLTLTGSLAVYAVVLGVIPYWLRWMAESGGERIWFYTGIYLALTVGAFVSVATAISTVFLAIAPAAGRRLHDQLLHTVLWAPQSFFATTDTGSTLNRFSADLRMLDRQLPFALFQTVQAVFRVLSQCVLLAVVQPRIAITLPLTVIVLYVTQAVYLSTSRQVRLLDLDSRALVHTSFLETLAGVTTIRAFGWQRPVTVQNAQTLDFSMRPDYLLRCIQCWLSIVLDLLVPGLAIGVIVLTVFLKGTTTGGQVGIALTAVLKTNSYLLRLVEAWTKLETSLGAVSRVRSFENDVPPEDSCTQALLPPPSWPSLGGIRFNHVSASYSAKATAEMTPKVLALNNVSVGILPGTKIGVVGRTGSGKSSLLCCLLRLVDLTGGKGSIQIDGLDICNLPRNVVRARIITVPQDAMIIDSDTLRQSLEMAGVDSIPDDDMVRVLKRVGLWDILEARSDNNDNSDDSDSSEGDDKGSPLETTMKALALSQGQQQLFSLARALLMRPSRGHIVLLDEATSNVDAETDRLMQAIVLDEFREHTVITVAHRLDTILDSDVVLVLDAGMLVEAGPPSELAARQGGALFKLIHGKRNER
ncbi:hypothetical protein SEUCBS139899_009986 [Sporothrix eucalyptigena]